MNNHITINFGSHPSGSLLVRVNDEVLHDGAICDVDSVFTLRTDNVLLMQFCGVYSDQPVIIKEIFVNKLSIEHFIYQGQFCTSDGQLICPLTDIWQDGHWSYHFSDQLAREIIKANT